MLTKAERVVLTTKSRKIAQKSENKTNSNLKLKNNI